MKYRLAKIDNEFEKEINDIIRQRIKYDRDKRPLSVRRITKALPKMSDWCNIKERLIFADMEDDRWK